MKLEKGEKIAEDKNSKVMQNWDGINKLIDCQTAHCGRHKLHFAFGSNTFPIGAVPALTAGSLWLDRRLS